MSKKSSLHTWIFGDSSYFSMELVRLSNCDPGFHSHPLPLSKISYFDLPLKPSWAASWGSFFDCCAPVQCSGRCWHADCCRSRTMDGISMTLSRKWDGCYLIVIVWCFTTIFLRSFLWALTCLFLVYCTCMYLLWSSFLRFHALLDSVELRCADSGVMQPGKAPEAPEVPESRWHVPRSSQEFPGDRTGPSHCPAALARKRFPARGPRPGRGSEVLTKQKTWKQIFTSVKFKIIFIVYIQVFSDIVKTYIHSIFTISRFKMMWRHGWGLDNGVFRVADDSRMQTFAHPINRRTDLGIT